VGVDEAAIRKAIRRGEVHLHPDGSVNVEASDVDWGHWHEFRTTPVELDPAWCQRIDAELEEFAS
jgi:hypothetical protein